MKKIQPVFCILLLLSFALNAQSGNMQKKQLNMLTLGDSNGSFPFSWPVQLGQAMPDAQVFNISKSGRTIGFLNLGDSSLNSLFVIDVNLRKAAELIKDDSYNFIVIELGTNDAKAVFDNCQKEVPGNLEILINKIKHSTYASISGAKIIIISPPPFGAKAEATVKYKGGDKRVEKMSKAFKKIARRNNCLFINGYKTPGLDINTMTADGIHLDETGSKKLIAPVVEAILSSAR
ncbi:MAG: GDSL-type esterase/lipase family protein [Ferruginibacter sp.]